MKHDDHDVPNTTNFYIHGIACELPISKLKTYIVKPVVNDY